MDERLVQKDSSQFWTEADSTGVKIPKKEEKSETGNWIVGAAIILGVSILLFVVFNTRSK